MQTFKKITLSLLAANLVCFSQVEAQYLDRLIDRTTNRVERKIDNKINRAADKAVDNTERKIESGVKGQINKTKNNKTDNTPSSTKTSTTATNASPSTAASTASIDSEKESEFTGSFQWEVKEYKSDKLVSNGNYFIDFNIKGFLAAAHILNGNTKDRQNSYVLNREKGNVAVLDDVKKVAILKSAQGIPNYLLAFKNTDEYEKVNGVSCTKYTAEEGTLKLTLWVDEAQRMPMLYSLKNGIGVEDKKFKILAYIAHLKMPIYKVIAENTKTNERIEINLIKLDTKAPNTSAFDYSEYQQK